MSLAPGLHLRSSRGYDITRDGRILVQTEGLEGTPSIVLIENVGEWLRRAQ